MTERRYIGRIVFGAESWQVITLQSHVDNVTKLVRLWQAERAYLNLPRNIHNTLSEISHKLLIHAAEIHDMGKPARFRLKVEKGRGGQPKWSDSYAGHRFAVEDENLYVYLLGQLHHEYSVDGIVEAMAQLRQRGYTDLAACLPLDLYSLEMADQIEATVARAALGDGEPEARVFMDFVFRAVEGGDAIYQLDPYPFEQEPIRLTAHYAVLTPPKDLIIAAEMNLAANQNTRLTELQNWLEEAFRAAVLEAKEITLWPWS